MTNQLLKSGWASASHALIHTRIHTPVGHCYHAMRCLSPLRAIRVQCLTQHSDKTTALFQVPPRQLSSSPCKTPSFHLETNHWVLPDSWCWSCILISQQLLIGGAQVVMANKHISSINLTRCSEWQPREWAFGFSFSCCDLQLPIEAASTW